MSIPIMSTPVSYDIKKKINAQSTLKGNKVDVFHETNPSLVKNKRYENYKRTIDISALEKFNITPYCFPSRINYENVSNIIYHPHKPEAGITSSQINLTQRQIVNDLINHTPNMYNGLDIKRCALKREPIIPQTSYLRGLLNEKDMAEVVRMGTTPKPQIPQPPAGPSDDYGQDKYAMKQYENKMIAEAYKEQRTKKEAMTKTKLQIQSLSSKPYIRPMNNPKERMKKIGEVMEKARIGQPVTEAITKLEDRLEDKKKKDIKEINDTRNTRIIEKGMTKLQAQFKGRQGRKEAKEAKRISELEAIKRISELEAIKRRIKPGKSKEAPVEFKSERKKQEEAVASSSSLVPKPVSKYDVDDDDDDDGSIDSGETTFDETKTMADHKTKLSGWGIPLDITDRISYSGCNKEKYDILNSIAKKLYQDNQVDRFVSMVSTANGKDKRKMKSLKKLREISVK